MPSSTLETQVGERRQTERRKQDGLGLLPRAKTPDEREHRERMNRWAGFLLCIFGAFVAGGSISLVASGGVTVGLLGLVLGGSTLAQGVFLIGRRDRRRRGRRKIRIRRRP